MSERNGRREGGGGGGNACVREGQFNFDAWWAMNQQNERQAEATGKFSISIDRNIELDSGGNPCHVGYKNGEANSSDYSAKSVKNSISLKNKFNLDCAFFIILAQLLLMLINTGIALYFFLQGL
jgi:hypothetical protein